MYEDLVRDLRDETYIYHFSRDYLQNIMFAAADAIEKLQKAVMRLEDESGILDELPMYQQPVGWIPVTERLPDENDRYLTVSIEPWFGTTLVDTMRWSGVWMYDGRMYDGRQTEATVTHWMPLPEPPKEE